MKTTCNAEWMDIRVAYSRALHARRRRALIRSTALVACGLVLVLGLAAWEVFGS